MKKVIVALTLGGVQTARKLQNDFDCPIYTLEKYSCSPQVLSMPTSLKSFIGVLFNEYQEIILIMSCGIAVRMIAPYLKSKKNDPAVVVMDEAGRHVISLLSGHIGGANRLAGRIAGMTNGEAVITTASDVQGIEAVDMLAGRLHLGIADWEKVKAVTAVLVNGGTVGVISPLMKDLNLGKGYQLLWEKESLKSDALLYIGNQYSTELKECNLPSTQLWIRNMVLGIGCRKGIDFKYLEHAISEFLQEHQYSFYSLGAIATVDIKKEEPAIVQLAEKWKIPLQIVTRQQIASVEHQFTGSDFVRKTIGVGCVCEPAAYLSSGSGKQMVSKTIRKHMTLSLYEATEVSRAGE